MKIVPVWAKAESGLTQAVGEYLKSSPQASSSPPAAGKWPSNTPGQSVGTYADLATKVDDTAGAIAFMDRASIGTRFSTATLKFGDEFVKVTDDALGTAVDRGTVSGAPGGGVQLTLQVGRGPGYSLGFVGYQAFCHTYKNPALARLVRSWAEYATGEGGQANSTYFAQVSSPSAVALERSNAAVRTIKRSTMTTNNPVSISSQRQSPRGPRNTRANRAPELLPRRIATNGRDSRCSHFFASLLFSLYSLPCGHWPLH